jgi:Uncharacterized conserved protein (COG2071)
MTINDIDATIERRLLVNYRIDREIAKRLLPAPFTPRLMNGHAMAGICLIHLRNARPAGLPAQLGIETQGAAHRIAVMWPRPDGIEAFGVYIPRRNSASWLAAKITGKSLATHRADFAITEEDDDFAIAMNSRDGGGSLNLRGHVTDALSDSSALASLDNAYAFFRDGGPGFSPMRPGRFAGIDLKAGSWVLAPVALEKVDSSWFSDGKRFPANTAIADSALVMRRTASRWRSVPDLIV